MLGPEKLAQLKGIMTPEEFASFETFQAGLDKKEKRQKSRTEAEKMVKEGGKYYKQYHEHDVALQAIWEKAQGEADKLVGIEEEETGRPVTQ